MSLIRQILFTLIVLVIALCGWVYFFPGAIDTLANRNLAFEPLKRIAALNSSQGDGKPAATGRQRGGRKTLVITAPVGRATVNDRLTAIGNGRAVQSVSVTPLVSGQLVELAAEPGAVVEKGTVIARLDSESEKLALEKAKLTAADLKVKADRVEELFRKRSATAAAVETAQAELATAELAVQEAQLNLDRRTIRSPIHGVVGIVAVSLGEYVTNQTAIVTIDNRDSIIVEFFVPERFATAIRVGAPVVASSVARPAETYSGKVVAIDNRVDVASRTLRIRAEIENLDDKLRAGMAFKVNMTFDGDAFPAVDPLAIQWDSKGSYVWLVGEDGKAQRTDARIVQRNPESVLVDAQLKEGDKVVTEGVQNVRQGATVDVAGEERAKPDSGKKAPVGS
ncbi:MAG: efflux RND transporter periplasmic adaptor subunit [Nitratireductor sp.]|nr:efflux RND transporter periplasmic adaptor subunit [Nitratireductor sp.]MCC0020324.1 efflux RND transporter periplasmic adaptor subunit [Nitratireductor sp.]